ncbi:MAG: hypothetical protein LBQ52_09840 [Helicobacteraceae bacterium]|jgi:predicted RNase H-like nuclease (RuvC/YqgF family)|nr:hypothetical protein [Helicobacteraceae bacterium]
MMEARIGQLERSVDKLVTKLDIFSDQLKEVLPAIRDVVILNEQVRSLHRRVDELDLALSELRKEGDALKTRVITIAVILATGAGGISAAIGKFL